MQSKIHTVSAAYAYKAGLSTPPPEVYTFSRQILFFLDDGIRKNLSARQVTDQIYDSARERPVVLQYMPQLKDYNGIKKAVEFTFQEYKNKKSAAEIDQGQGTFDFNNFGRKTTAGPKYGEWCGGDWTGGTNMEFASPTEPMEAPVDSLDAVCETHDHCYDQAIVPSDKLECDAELVQALDQLDPDPNNWARPPSSPDMAEKAKLYRQFGEFFFRGKLVLID